MDHSTNVSRNRHCPISRLPQIFSNNNIEFQTCLIFGFFVMEIIIDLLTLKRLVLFTTFYDEPLLQGGGVVTSVFSENIRPIYLHQIWLKNQVSFEARKA